jgi:hypothetical protein
MPSMKRVVRIIWTADKTGAFIKSPYDPGFVDALKRTVPWTSRGWEPISKRWWVAKAFVEDVAELAMEYYDEVTYEDSDEVWHDEPRTTSDTRGSSYQANYKRMYEEARAQVEDLKVRLAQAEAAARRARSYNPPNTWGSGGRGNGDPAYDELYVLENAPMEVVKGAYRALAMMNHPDHGGDTAKMQKINAAFDRIQKLRGG